MWLLNVHTLELEDFVGNDIPEYAILSHTWDREEVTFKEMMSKTGREKAGFKKIQSCCNQAKRDDLRYCWIDTCCIDKSSSAELSEAINSMFSWYEKSFVCYAHLSDLKTSNGRGSDQGEISLNDCRWFTRGWTLQELIAPVNMIFFACDWTEVGSKLSLARELESVTSVPYGLLTHTRQLSSYSVALRLSWAAKRQTTRTEDVAYCLFGLFDINLPLLYGEGHKAFMRLQKEILRTIGDQSIFAWLSEDQVNSMDEHECDYFPDCRGSQGFLASSPDHFGTFFARYRKMSPDFSDILSTSRHLGGLDVVMPPDPISTLRGIQVDYPVLTMYKEAYMLLPCWLVSDDKFLRLKVRIHDSTQNGSNCIAREGSCPYSLSWTAADSPEAEVHRLVLLETTPIQRTYQIHHFVEMNIMPLTGNALGLEVVSSNLKTNQPALSQTPKLMHFEEKSTFLLRATMLACDFVASVWNGGPHCFCQIEKVGSNNVPRDVHTDVDALEMRLASRNGYEMFLTLRLCIRRLPQQSVWMRQYCSSFQLEVSHILSKKRTTPSPEVVQLSNSGIEDILNRVDGLGDA